MIEELLKYQEKWLSGDFSTLKKDIDHFNYLYKKCSDIEQQEYHHILCEIRKLL